MLFLIKYFHSIVALQIFLNTFIHCFFSGKQLANIETKTAVRACNFSFSGRYIMFTTDKTMGHPCEIYIYDVTDTCKFQNFRTKKTQQISNLQTIYFGHLSQLLTLIVVYTCNSL